MTRAHVNAKGGGRLERQTQFDTWDLAQSYIYLPILYRWRRSVRIWEEYGRWQLRPLQLYARGVQSRGQRTCACALSSPKGLVINACEVSWWNRSQTRMDKEKGECITPSKRGTEHGGSKSDCSGEKGRHPFQAGYRLRWGQERFALARRVSDSRRGRDSKDGVDNRMRTVFTNQGYISRFPLRWKKLRVRSTPSSGDGKAKRQRTLPVARVARSSCPKSACFC
ncbi:hypothetical protein F5882DRAFT_138589 [Hyaloscypha sp. PMI_1271]|nr:hypothetical protein F5882DRAFT_138589 [Hyaloscypha sp. PMI_1271]